jgi:hypothetical protein
MSNNMFVTPLRAILAATLAAACGGPAPGDANAGEKDIAKTSQAQTLSHAPHYNTPAIRSSVLNRPELDDLEGARRDLLQLIQF